ncbi:protein disulfide-isomerase A2 precursor [Xenopus tropicalis]|uniref:Protein disulfide-isomerase n=1 Tax=Xenopus tropicalis TaxID=8364 RepID=Q5M8J6_XENTR|eukprot:NP_001011281.1 protein disulfide-isomerase A2 precursor [Xenopus tropicalis]
MRWLTALQLCLLCTFYTVALGQNATSEEPTKNSSEEETSDELLEEDNVLVLNKKNFDKALETYKYLLVEFYAPWCGHCQELAPKYAKAAEILKDKSEEVRLAKVDATVESELSMEFNVNGYPTLKFFKGGNRTGHIDYGGKRDQDGLVKWMLRRLGPAAIVLDKVESAEKFTSSQESPVIGFFKNPEDADIKIFYEAAELNEDFTFALAHDAKLFEKFGVTEDTVIFFKNSEEKPEFKVDEDLGLDKDELSKFLKINNIDLVTEYSAETSDKIFAAQIPNHLLLFINKTEDSQLALLEHFRKAATHFKGKILFVFIDSDGGFSSVLEYFGLKSSDVPTLRFINLESVKKYAFDAPEITEDTIQTFCRTVLEGNVKQNLMSEEIPADWDKNPVKVLVGKNFEEVAYDESKSVFVEFYAPWCSHCKELEPVWEELGEKYKDHESVIIAKMDATANEIDGLRVRGFPNLRFFPAGPGRKMIEYTKERTVELFSAFIDSGGVLPEEQVEKDAEAEESKEVAEEDKGKDEL